MKTIKQIIQEEAKAAGLSYETLISYNNTLRVIAVRRKAMYRAHIETDKTFTQIARVFKRDHTTIISGINYEKRRVSFCDPSNNPNWGAAMSKIKEYFLEQYEELQYTIPDIPRDEPCENVNKPLWQFWSKWGKGKDMTEAEIVQYMDTIFW